ncbi:carotenoid oxygenase family protein [Sorangium sp. So ce542]|uniref:carotenoid oxygenase family protein n=1 Tax=Sorangium sp. So ce542 TaxID=3133316 RepID=UPI003F5F3EC1
MREAPSHRAFLRCAARRPAHASLVGVTTGRESRSLAHLQRRGGAGGGGGLSGDAAARHRRRAAEGAERTSLSRKEVGATRRLLAATRERAHDHRKRRPSAHSPAGQQRAGLRGGDRGAARGARKIPSELFGRCVRNGPNPRTGWSAHAFAGVGMVHGIALEGGQGRSYWNRYVRSSLCENPGVTRFALAFDAATSRIDHRVSTANTHVIARPARRGGRPGRGRLRGRSQPRSVGGPGRRSRAGTSQPRSVGWWGAGRIATTVRSGGRRWPRTTLRWISWISALLIFGSSRNVLFFTSRPVFKFVRSITITDRRDRCSTGETWRRGWRPPPARASSSSESATFAAWHDSWYCPRT